MKIISTLKCTEYNSPGHPESPQRVKDAYNLLKRKGYEIIEPASCSDKDILSVHSINLLESVKNGSFFDPDTPNISGIFDHARLSAGAALEAMQITLKGEKAFSLMRPPGHHATKNRLGGFCYFNNIAIAVKKNLDELRRVAILDIDVHHGNGTQDIFQGVLEVLYISLHQSPLFPGTGLNSTGNCLNYIIPAHTKEKEYIAVLKKALERIEDFRPNMLAISAGFDTFAGDPLANIGLDEKSYFKIGEMVADLDVPTFAVLEGGYSENLADCIYEFVQGLDKN